MIMFPIICSLYSIRLGFVLFQTDIAVSINPIIIVLVSS